MVQQQIALFWCAKNFTFRRRRKKIGAGFVCRDLMHWTVMKSVALRYVSIPLHCRIMDTAVKFYCVEVDSKNCVQAVSLKVSMPL